MRSTTDCSTRGNFQTLRTLTRVCLLPLLCLPVVALAGYDLHITRATEWTLSSEHPISELEWKATVASDGQIQMVSTATAKNTKTHEVLQAYNPLMASWVDPSSKEKHYFYYFQGEISVKNPSKNAIAKMKAIARKLSARVQGDEGEWY